MTRSQVSASAATLAISRPSSTTPPVFARVLWQDTQYWLTSSRGVLDADALAFDCAAASSGSDSVPDAVPDASRNAAIEATRPPHTITSRPPVRHLMKPPSSDALN